MVRGSAVAEKPCVRQGSIRAEIVDDSICMDDDDESSTGTHLSGLCK